MGLSRFWWNSLPACGGCDGGGGQTFHTHTHTHTRTYFFIGNCFGPQQKIQSTGTNNFPIWRGRGGRGVLGAYKNEAGAVWVKNINGSFAVGITQYKNRNCFERVVLHAHTHTHTPNEATIFFNKRVSWRADAILLLCIRMAGFACSNRGLLISNEIYFCSFLSDIIIFLLTT